MKKSKTISQSKIEVKNQNDQLTDEMLDDLKQVVEFHKLYLNIELENEKENYESLSARIEELKTELENAEITTDKANEGFYF